MRKLVIAIVLFFVLGGVALAFPYRSERIVGTIIGNNTGCTINAADTGGRDSTGTYHRLVEPIRATVAVYECKTLPSGRPAKLILTSPETGYREEGCIARPEDGWCLLFLPRIPEAGALHRYRLMVQLRPGEQPVAVEIEVRRDIEWRSGTLDAIMSV